MSHSAIKCMSTIKIEKYSCSIEWKIQKKYIDELLEETYSKQGSAYFDTGFHETTLNLMMYRHECNHPRHLSLFLFGACNKNLSVKFRIIMKGNQLKGSADYVGEYKSLVIYDNGKGYGDYIEIADIEKETYWNENYLTIICEVQMSWCTSQDITNTVQYLPPPPANEKPLKDTYAKLLESGSHADVTFMVGKRSFKAHRGILVTRCKSLATLFGRVKKLSDPIKIVGVKPNVFEAILHFIYTNEPPDDITGIAKDLFIAAHKFELQELLEKCDHHLRQNITLDNCIELLVFADTYNRICLKESAMWFIRHNIEEVVDTDAWNEFKGKNIQLAFDLVEGSILIKKEPKD